MLYFKISTLKFYIRACTVFILTQLYCFFKHFLEKDDILKITGIIAEFNPFHNGHKYIIDCAKKNNSTHIAAAISGNFVERGDSAVISKFARAEQALKNGVDLVFEIPVSFSLSGANYYAKAGISILSSVCNEIVFGSECGDIDILKNTADLLDTYEVNELIKQYIKTGINFPSAREKALKNQKLLNQNKILTLKNPNDILGVEYIRAAKELNLQSNLKFKTFKRQGAEHNSLLTKNEFASASYLRNIILNSLNANKNENTDKNINNENIEHCKRFMPKSAFDILVNEYNSGRISDINNLYLAVKAKILLKNEEMFYNITDVSEGIEKKIIKAAQNSKTLDELYFNVKSKRYTLSRIRRIILNSFLDIDNSYLQLPLPYLRVLAFNKKGEEILKTTKNKNLNIITSLKKAENLNDAAKKLSKKEFDAGNIYSLTYNEVNNDKSFLNEYTQKIIKK